MIGCQILYARQTRESLPVIFTLNERVVGKALIKIKENTPLGAFYAYIGIGWKEISLQFRVRMLSSMFSTHTKTAADQCMELRC